MFVVRARSKVIAKRLCENTVLVDGRLNLEGANKMVNVNLNLPEELQQFVNGQVEAGEFDGPNAYIEALIVRAKMGKEKIEELLIEGLNSGESIPLDANEWSRIRGEVTERLSNGQ